MKKLQLLFILAISICLASCGGDDPLSTSIVDSTWQLVSIEQTGCNDPSENIPLTLVENGCIMYQGNNECNHSIRFLANGNGNFQYLDESDVEMFSFTYTVNDDVNEITFCEDANDCLILTVDGDDLNWSVPDSDGCLSIAKFTKA